MKSKNKQKFLKTKLHLLKWTFAVYSPDTVSECHGYVLYQHQHQNSQSRMLFALSLKHQAKTLLSDLMSYTKSIKNTIYFWLTEKKKT